LLGPCATPGGDALAVQGRPASQSALAAELVRLARLSHEENALTNIMNSMVSAIEILKRLEAVNEKVKNAEFTNLIADLNMEFAALKLNLTGVEFRTM
jgi:hypothetical protein